MKKALHHFVKIFTCLALLTSAVTVSAQIVWQHCYGGSSGDGLEKGISTLDGGYIFVGFTGSHDGDADSNHAHLGGDNVWVVKIAASGALQWENCYGGTNLEKGFDILQNADSTYWVAASCKSFDSGIIGSHGGWDMWLTKLNPFGDMISQLCIGGCGDELAKSIVRTTDGGLIIAGSCDSNCGIVTGYHYSPATNDIWVVKLSATNSVEWAKTFGGTNEDEVSNIIQTLDGGYIFCGNTYSNDGNVSGNHGNTDIWVVKLNDTGAIQWEKCLGGTDYEGTGNIIQNADSTYFISGGTHSSDGDVTFNLYSGAFFISGWIIKLAPNGEKQWDKCINQYGFEAFATINPTKDNEYICTGTTRISYLDTPSVWVVKLSDTAKVEWEGVYGGSNSDVGMNALQNPDSSYTVFAQTVSNNGDVSGNHGGTDGWVFNLGKTTSIKTVTDAMSISIYPNPAENTITISSPLVLGVVSIWSMVGQLVTTISSNETKVTTDLADLLPGIYLININNRTTARFLKK
jgi:Secretion system C-terminal sorting domain